MQPRPKKSVPARLRQQATERAARTGEPFELALTRLRALQLKRTLD